jgi:RNA polymerase sigma-70 factor, ECF subfamily
MCAVTALETLYCQYADTLVGYLRRKFSCSREDAEDLMQETFLKAARALPTMPASTPWKAWLFVIARNTAFDWRRHLTCAGAIVPSRSLEDMTQEYGDTFASAETLEHSVVMRLSLEAALTHLKPRQQLVVRALARGLSLQETARCYGLTYANTKTIAMRARLALKQHDQEVQA